MFDIALISRALAGSGLSVHDSDIERIMRLSQSGEHQSAAEGAADRLADGGTDIRLIAAYALGAFEESGPATLPALLGALADGLSQRWAVIRPEARREAVVDSALSLLFRTIKALIDYHETTRGAAWQAWAERVTPELPAACATAIGALRGVLGVRLDKARALGELSGVESRASLYFNRLPPRPAAPPPAPAATPEPEPEPEPAARPEDKPLETPERPARTLDISPALEGFMRKLDVFDQLLSRGDMMKAAIVAQDIRADVDHFDPRVYLPKLLAPFFRKLSVHAAELAAQGEASHGAAWDALLQLYRVDPDAFLEP